MLELLEVIRTHDEGLWKSKYKKIWEVVAIQLGFMPDKGIMDAILIAHLLTLLCFYGSEKKYLRKLSINEWLVRVAMTNRNSNSVIWVNNTVGDKFDVKVAVYLGSFLYPLLFVVLEALSRECRSTLHWVMLYADDLVMIPKSLVELDIWYAALKHCSEGEGQGLRMNLAKTKVIISDINWGLRKAHMRSLL